MILLPKAIITEDRKLFVGIVGLVIPDEDNKMLSEQDKEAASKIGAFYLQKNNRDFKATEKEIMDLRISKVRVLDNKVIEITAERVGLLIGRRGVNIDSLIKFLGVNVHIIEEADPITYYLIPQDWDDNDY